MPIDGENSDLCIPLLPPEDPSRLNVSYTCSTTRGSVVWLLGDYEMVDRDQFLAFGVLIEDSSNGSSRLTLQPNGAQFLRDSFSSDIYDISCITVLDEVNTRPSPTVLTVYYAGQSTTNLLGCVGHDMCIYLCATANTAILPPTINEHNEVKRVCTQIWQFQMTWELTL